MHTLISCTYIQWNCILVHLYSYKQFPHLSQVSGKSRSNVKLTERVPHVLINLLLHLWLPNEITTGRIYTTLKYLFPTPPDPPPPPPKRKKKEKKNLSQLPINHRSEWDEWTIVAFQNFQFTWGKYCKSFEPPSALNEFLNKLSREFSSERWMGVTRERAFYRGPVKKQ